MSKREEVPPQIREAYWWDREYREMANEFDFDQARQKAQQQPEGNNDVNTTD